MLGIVLGAKALAADGAPDTAAEPAAPAGLWSKDDGCLDFYIVASRLSVIT